MDLIEKIKNNKITKKLLASRNLETDDDLNAFFYPSLDNLKDPFEYSGVAECVEKINKAVLEKKKILICGDYDTDGISASFVLFDYLKSLGNVCDVHIPNRVSEGYGISLDYILSLENKPDLVITVDCGISCAEEIKNLKNAGIDVIVTDHHNYPDVAPDCVIFDPKIEKNLFDGFCGAGVVFKLVQAMGGIDAAKKYLDIVAVATIGDIVPLVDENRTIVKFGLEMLNSNPNKNLKLLLNFLELSNLSSTDIPFKLVPFLNSAGRVGSAEKVFKMLCSQNEDETMQLIYGIDKNNEQRLKSKEQGIEEIKLLLQDIDLNEEPCLFLKSANFDEGIIGILASMTANKYCRPAIIFTEKDGVFKGSGRSYGNFNLHNAVTKFANLCEKVGGHDYACGLSIKPENFEEFKHCVSSDVADAKFGVENEFDFEIDAEDIVPELFELIEKFEPFGLDNPKPKFMLMAQKMSYDYLTAKSHRHFLLNVDGVKIVAFFAKKYLQTFDSNEIKQLVIELNVNRFNGKTNNQVVLKNVLTKDVFRMVDDEDEVIADEILFAYNSINCDYDAVEIDLEGLAEIANDTKKFGTVFVCRRNSELEKMKAVLKAIDKHLPIRFRSADSSESLVCTNFDIDLEQYENYKRVVYLGKPFLDINLKAKDGQEIYVLEEDDAPFENKTNLSCERSAFAYSYSAVDKFIKQNTSFEDLCDAVEYVEKTQNVLSKSQIMLNFCVFLENSLISIKKLDNGKICFVRGTMQKNELENSKIYRIVSEKI